MCFCRPIGPRQDCAEWSTVANPEKIEYRKEGYFMVKGGPIPQAVGPFGPFERTRTALSRPQYRQVRRDRD
jgi:hypothetical protein